MLTRWVANSEVCSPGGSPSDSTTCGRHPPCQMTHVISHLFRAQNCRSHGTSGNSSLEQMRNETRSRQSAEEPQNLIHLQPLCSCCLCLMPDVLTPKPTRHAWLAYVVNVRVLRQRTRVARRCTNALANTGSPVSTVRCTAVL